MAGELFDESHYFMCAGGLKPCSFNAGQEIMKQKTGKHYLMEQSLTTRNGDFSCRWMALLAAIIAALIVVLCASGVGMVLLAAMAGAAAGAGGGMALCGYKAAVARTWLVIKTDAQIGTKNMVVNRPGEHLKCAAFGQPIVYLPNVTTEFHAMLLFAGNVTMTGLEGFMYAYATRGVGMLVTKPLTFFANFGVNYLKTLSVQGVAMRGAFGVWSGFDAYSKSQTKMTGTEAFQNEEVLSAAGNAFLFAEGAAYRLATQDYTAEQKKEGNQVIPKMYDEDGNETFDGVNLPAWTNDAALLLSLGGIKPMEKGTKDATWKDLKDAPKSVVNSWKKAPREVISKVSKILEETKKFREKLRNKKKGTGAHEKVQLSQKAKDILQDMVKEAEGMTRKKRPGVACILEKGEKIVNRYSRKGFKPGEIPSDLHPLVETWLKEAPKELQNRNNHGKCGEPTAISEWLYEAEVIQGIEKGKMGIDEARVELNGVKSSAVEINIKELESHGKFKDACVTCNPLLEYFGIEEVGHSHN